MKLFIYTFILASFFIQRPAAQAEWGNFENVDVVINHSNSKINVKSSGLAIIEEERMFTSLNETGRNRLSLETIPFSPDLVSIQILRASSITDGVETPIDIKTIHERTAAGSRQGISGMKELVIPFTNLKIGSSIKYKIFMKEKKTHFAGNFSSGFIYGLKEPELSGEVLISSQKKLNFAALDPIKALEITEGTEKGLFTLKIKMLKPVSRAIKNEGIPIYNHNSFPMVQVTTFQNWSEFVKGIAPKYEKVLSQELPPAFNEIIAKAAKKTDIYDKIDTVTSELASIMTYSGNWTTLDKMFFPRGHVEVAKSKTGDCKDFATSTAAMLRKMGIKANVGLVNRKSPYEPGNRLQSFPLKDGFAYPLFNHAIVRVEMPDKSILWVDPTNTTSNSRAPGLDIAESAALNLAANVSSVEIIPSSKIEDHKITVEKTIKITPDDKAESVGTLAVKGLISSEIKNTAFLKNSKSADELVLAVYGSSAKEGVKADYQSRIAGSFQADLKTYGENIFIEKEGQKSLIVVLPKMIEFYNMGYAPHRVSDFFGAPKGQYYSKVQVDGFDFDENETTGCWAASPWFEIERKLLKNEKGFEVRDQVVFKKDFIPASELNDDEYSYSLGDISECVASQKIDIIPLVASKPLAERLKNYNFENINKLFDNNAQTLSRTSRTIKVIVDQMLEKDPANMEALLHKVRAVRSLSYRVNRIFGPTYLDHGIEWVDEVLKKDENNADALIQKAFLYSFMNNMPEAKKYFTKAYYASKVKGFELYRLGGYIAERTKDYKMATQSYLKSIEVAKTEIERAKAWRELGIIAGNQEDFKKAEDYYSRALSHDKDNVWLMNDLLIAADNSGNLDKAIEIGEKILLKSANFGAARSNLSNAYCSKARDIKNKNAESVESWESVKDLAMKGLKWTPNHLQCNWSLAQSYGGLARLKSDATLAERSASLWLKAAELSNQSSDKERALKAHASIKLFKQNLETGGSRMPASEVPTAAVSGPIPGKPTGP